MRKWLAMSVLAAVFVLGVVSESLAWRPSGWVFFNYPYVYDRAAGDWHWFNTPDTQWVNGFSAGGWGTLNVSGMANGWSFLSWPYAYCSANGSWYYINEIDTQWVINLRTSAWSLFGTSVGSGETARIPRTGQTSTHRAGDDGSAAKGVAWPSPRFTDQGNGTVTDRLTGLVWVKAPQSLPGNSAGMAWSAAVDFCNGLNHAGLTDWRLPNVNELRSILDAGQHSPALPSGYPFTGSFSHNFWTSTTAPFNTGDAWQILVSSGYMANVSKSSAYRVWPVRGEP